MTKFFICLFVFISIVCDGFSQSLDSLVNIKGYYVTRLLKNEISDSYNQKIKRLNDESYSTPIDYKMVSFFMPFCIDNETINDNSNFIKIISVENNLDKDSIYFLPVSKQIEKYMKKALNINVTLSKEICIFSESWGFSPYYISLNNDQYLYKLMYIDAEFLKTTILNTEEARFPFYLDAYSVNRTSQSIDLFFILKINFYSTNINIEKLKEWVPYLDMK